MENLIVAVRSILVTTPDRWERLVANVPADLLERAPAPGEWSAHECLQHLYETEHQAFPVRVRAFLAGQNFPNFDPDAEPAQPDTRTLPELLAAFVAERTQNLPLLDNLTEADFARTAQHPNLGRVTLGDMLHEWAAHDLNHTIQAERAIMQPFIQGSGAWRFYFVEHDVEAKASPSV